MDLLFDMNFAIYVGDWSERRCTSFLTGILPSVLVTSLRKDVLNF